MINLNFWYENIFLFFSSINNYASLLFFLIAFRVRSVKYLTFLQCFLPFVFEHVRSHEIKVKLFMENILMDFVSWAKSGAGQNGLLTK